MDANTAEWIRCPVCGSKTRDKMRKDTILKNSLYSVPNVTSFSFSIISDTSFFLFCVGVF